MFETEMPSKKPVNYATVRCSPLALLCGARWKFRSCYRGTTSPDATEELDGDPSPHPT